MGSSAADRVTQILESIRTDSRVRGEELIAVLYDELRTLARSQLSRLRPGETLQPTALVHEAYLRLMKSPNERYDDRRYFFAAAAQAMWRILVEECRKKSSRKHGAGLTSLPLEDLQNEIGGLVLRNTDDLLAIDQALVELGPESREAQVVLLRFFVGLSTEEMGEQLGVSVSTIERDWRFARAFLRRYLTEQTD